MEFQGLSEVGEGALDRLSLTCHVDLQRLGNEPVIFLPHARRASVLTDLVSSSEQIVVRRHRDPLPDASILAVHSDPPPLSPWTSLFAAVTACCSVGCLAVCWVFGAFTAHPPSAAGTT